jgi:hypothetical protein
MWQVRTAVVMPHGDFVYAPQLIDYKNGSRELQTAAQVMMPMRRRAVARALALVALSSFVSTCLAKVYPPAVSPFCRARAPALM